MNRRFLWPVTLVVCISILVAGLWPFDFHPENGVDWLGGENGVRFHGRGVVNGEDVLIKGGPVSIEIWLRPDPASNVSLPRILSFYDGSHESLFVGRWRNSLVLRSVGSGRFGRESHREADADDVFSDGRKSFLTITSGADGTTAFLDGRVARAFPGFALSTAYTGASLSPVLGNSPTGKQCWPGEIFGLAVYDRALSPDEVSLSYRSWMENGMPPFPQGEGPVALYLFDERAGSVVHNHQGPLHRLVIPAEFRPPARTVLVPPWRDFALNRSYLEDILVNIAGFVPFGFFVFALLQGVTPLKGRRKILVVVLLGFGLSLLIELLQVYLPGRDSQLSDLIDNTLGTVIGAIMSARFDRRSGH